MEELLPLVGSAVRWLLVLEGAEGVEEATGLLGVESRPFAR
jgi:hypothetical protein